MTAEAQHYQEPIPKKMNKDSIIKSEERAPTVYDIPGVGAATAEKLAEAGFDTVLSIAVATPGQLVEAAGVGDAAARKMIKFCRDALSMGFESGESVLEKRSKVIKISTGVKSFDLMMAGGFETGAITECYGEFGSSKTQIAHVLCVQNYKRNPDSYSVYIDTENTFRPERIIELAQGAGLDAQEVLKSIKVAKAYNSDHQILLAEKVDDLINKDGLDVKVVIVDSLTAHFRAEFVGRGTLAERQQKIGKFMHVPEFVGRGTLAERQQKIGKFMHVLAKLADLHNVCVYVTNQVMAKPDQFFGDPTAPIGGHIVGHSSTFRIYLRKGKKGSRVAKLVDAPNLPDSECAFYVTKEGLVDFE